MTEEFWSRSSLRSLELRGLFWPMELARVPRLVDWDHKEAIAVEGYRGRRRRTASTVELQSWGRREVGLGRMVGQRRILNFLYIVHF